MIRYDIAYPFAIDPASGQAARASYQDHVDQMIRQVLLTDPGERVCLPTFGAGLRRLLFAPLNSSLSATTKLVVTTALNQWMGGQINVKDVTVVPPGTITGGAPPPDGAIVIQISYVLVETQTVQKTLVQVL
jgi:phage baseplate assembly protein W